MDFDRGSFEAGSLALWESGMVFQGRRSIVSGVLDMGMKVILQKI